MKVLNYEGLKTFATKIKSLLDGKQDNLTAGSNITITNNKISATDTKYTHPSSHSANMITENANKRFVSDAEKSIWNGKQDKLTAGDNITISNNKISTSPVKIIETVEVPLKGAGKAGANPEGKLVLRKYSNGFCSMEMNTGLAEGSKSVRCDIPVGFGCKSYVVASVRGITSIFGYTEIIHGQMTDTRYFSTHNASLDETKGLIMNETFYVTEK